jgi:hypothetical protein
MSSEDLGRLIREQMERTAELQLRLRGVVGEAAAPDASVSIRVGPTGVPQDLQISERALSMGGRRLAQTILDCVGKAGAEASAQTRQLVTEVLGDRVDLDTLLPQPGSRPRPSPPSGSDRAAS